MNDEPVNPNSCVGYDINHKLDIYRAYADLLLKYSRKKKICLINGKVTSSDKNGSVYNFDIEPATIKQMKNMHTDYKFEYIQNEYDCEIISLEKDCLKLNIRSFPLNTDIIQNGAIVVDMQFIIKRQSDALEKLSLPQYEKQRQIIFGNCHISGGQPIECDFRSMNPNEKQKIGIQHAAGVNDAYMIWGPPGTGKTTVVPDIVHNYVRLQKEKRHSKLKILVCSYTNTAVDNIVEKLFDEFKSTIVRIGKSTTLSGKYKHIGLPEIIREETAKIDDELKKIDCDLMEVRKKQDDDQGTIVNELNNMATEIKILKEKIIKYEEDITALENQKRERMKQIIINRYQKKKEDIENRIMHYNKKIEELDKCELAIMDQRHKIKSEMSRIERNISEYNKLIIVLQKDAFNNENMIKIVNTYLEASKKNALNALIIKTKHYNEHNKYYDEIRKLKINDMNYDELESLSSQLISEKNIIKTRVTETISELKKYIEMKENKNQELHEINNHRHSLKKDALETTDSLKNANIELEIINDPININRFQAIDNELQMPYIKNDQSLIDFDCMISEKNRLLFECRKKSDSLRYEHISLTEKVNEINEKFKDMAKHFEQLKAEIELKKNDLATQILRERMIIATTNMTACDRLLNDITFDLIIMDESGAIDLLGAIIPLMKTEKTIFLGDPNQLPPVVIDDNENIYNFREEHPELQNSIFEIFRKRSPDEDDESKTVMLTKQYRMRKEISDFVSEAFYKNRLVFCKSDENYILKENTDPILDNRHPMLCVLRTYHTQYKDKSGYCLGEIRFIKNIIKNFKNAYGEAITDKIAVITPFRAQADMIRKEIPSIDCGTVHTFQGQEKEIIIYLTVKYRQNSNGTFGKFLDSEISKKLLNVAVSRTREKYIIIGCKELFNTVALYNKLYNHIKKHNGIIDRKLEGYDDNNTCKSCGTNIEDKYEYCYECKILEDIRTFLEDKPRTIKADDTHLVRSNYEARIDDWFYRKGIEHEVEKTLPINKFILCDWFLPKKDKFKHDIYVEYWGLMGKTEYEEHRKVKEKLYRENNLILLNIEPDDMKALDDILERKLRKFRISGR